MGSSVEALVLTDFCFSTVDVGNFYALKYDLEFDLQHAVEKQDQNVPCIHVRIWNRSGRDRVFNSQQRSGVSCPFCEQIEMVSFPLFHCDDKLHVKHLEYLLPLLCMIDMRQRQQVGYFSWMDWLWFSAFWILMVCCIKPASGESW